VSKSQAEALRNQLAPVVAALSNADLLDTLREARAEQAWKGKKFIVAALVAEASVRKLQWGE
jgi:hypothetical protein